MTEFSFCRRVAGRIACSLALCLAAPMVPAQSRAPATPNMADYIVAVVNQELVTNGELQSRLAGIRADAEPTISTRHLRLAALSAECSPSLYFQIKRN